MAEKFAFFASGVASGTDKTIWNLFNPAAAPTSRGRIKQYDIGSVATPADQAAKFSIGRTTAVGTEGSGFVPNNLDPAGPAGAYDSGIGAFSAEPTYTASKNLKVLSANQRSTPIIWLDFGYEFLLAATQNNGAGLKTLSSTSTQAYESSVIFEE